MYQMCIGLAVWASAGSCITANSPSMESLCPAGSLPHTTIPPTLPQIAKLLKIPKILPDPKTRRRPNGNVLKSVKCLVKQMVQIQIFHEQNSRFRSRWQNVPIFGDEFTKSIIW